MERRMTDKVSLAGLVAAIFVVLAIAGSFFVSREMNRTADQHGMSAGRPGDASPNLIQEQQNDRSARGASSRADQNSAVPPASR